MEEKGPLVYNSPKRRCCIIVLIVLGLLVFAAIGIVAGYFIGRNAAKSCDDGDSKTPSGKQSQKQLEEFRRNAVKMISTEELRNNLK